MTPEDRIELPEPPPSTLAKGSRRRLLRGGLAAAPALLTLVNRPVMADVACFSPSVGASADLSRRGSVVPECEGRTASYWAGESSFAHWPVPMASPGTPKPLPSHDSGADVVSATTRAGKNETIAGPSTLKDSSVLQDSPEAKPAPQKGTTFDSVFGRQGGFPSKTLVEVLSVNTNSGRDGLARHLVAAYLNVLKGLIPPRVLDVPTVKNIWASYVARGYYEPTAGIRWFPDHAEPANKLGGIIAWLKTTMPR